MACNAVTSVPRPTRSARDFGAFGARAPPRGPAPARIVMARAASSSDGGNVKVQQQQQNGTSSMQQQPQQQQPQRRQPSLSPFDLWDPFMPTSRTFSQMLDMMNQMMDSSLPGANVATPRQRRSGGLSRSPWDVMEDDESFKMRVDMPGLTKEEVSVTVDDNQVLVIKGEMSRERKEKDEWVARSSGSYESRVALPDNVDVEKIQAELRDGVLYVTVPKKKVEPKKRISVQVC